jgi:hypothetical protein
LLVGLTSRAVCSLWHLSLLDAYVYLVVISV